MIILYVEYDYTVCRVIMLYVVYMIMLYVDYMIIIIVCSVYDHNMVLYVEYDHIVCSVYDRRV